MDEENITQFTHDQQLSQMAKILREHKDRIRKFENNLVMCQQRIRTLAEREPTYLDPEGSYMSALTYSTTRDTGFVTHLRFAHALDERAADMCRELGIRIGREPNSLWGWVNLYPLEVLQECQMIMEIE